MSVVSFVIPCYRSEKTIESVVDEIRRSMALLTAYDYEIILVNDCSPDGTFAVISHIAKNDRRVTAVDLTRNFGQHAALMAGFHHCSGDIVVCLDDDGQTPADEVGKLLDKLEEGYDVVYASYEHKQHSLFRNWGTRLNNKMTEIMLGKPRELSIPSYLAARRFIIDEMLNYKNCFPYVDGLVLRTTRRLCNVPVTHRAREEGGSGYTLAKLISLWMNGFTSFSAKPLRIASFLGCFTALCGFVYAIIIVIKHFIDSSIPVGWSSAMALQLILGGIILLVLGLVGEYIGRMYLCINSSPQYVERQVIKERERQTLMEKTDRRVYIALHLLLLFYSLSAVLSKLAAAQAFLSLPFCLCYGGMIVILGVYALGWQQILKRLPLTVAFANKAVTLVWSMVFGALLFKESISLRQLLGCALAVAGVVLFVQPEKEASREP